jgi:hypothetical protein
VGGEPALIGATQADASIKLKRALRCSATGLPLSYRPATHVPPEYGRYYPMKHLST